MDKWDSVDKSGCSSSTLGLSTSKNKKVIILPIMEYCKCGVKIPYRSKLCDTCKADKEKEQKQRLKDKNKKYNRDRYLRDKENESYRLFYSSKAWIKKRQEILNRDENHCVICRALCKYTVASDVHHVKNLINHYELRLDNDNLCSLCSDCHKLVHRLELDSKDKIEKYIEQRRREDKFIKELLKDK